MMEDKLLELKEQFCKWYCPNKQKEDNSCKQNCEYCPSTEMIICHGLECEICMVSDFIKHIRDELN